MDNHEFTGLLAELFGDDPWPRPLHLLQGARRVQSGEGLGAAARAVGTSAKRLEEVATAPDPVEAALGVGIKALDGDYIERARNMLGQLVLGRSAELAFEEIYRSEMHGREFQLKDLRESRTDTDYRLLNGDSRPVYRVNIKFHGSQFRRAPELVGLEPEDCFALATYKISSALQKQEAEGLPYLFAIVGVPHLSGAVVGAALPERLLASAALMHQAPKGRAKRDFEDRLVDYVVGKQLPVFAETERRIADAEWFILSARRADRLLREKLFDRVYALRIRGFAQAFRGAELDMHFSLAEDLVPLRRFLSTLRESGSTKVTTLLERGDF